MSSLLIAIAAIFLLLSIFWKEEEYSVITIVVCIKDSVLHVWNGCDGKDCERGLYFKAVPNHRRQLLTGQGTEFG